MRDGAALELREHHSIRRAPRPEVGDLREPLLQAGMQDHLGRTSAGVDVESHGVRAGMRGVQARPRVRAEGFRSGRVLLQSVRHRRIDPERRLLRVVRVDDLVVDDGFVLGVVDVGVRRRLRVLLGDDVEGCARERGGPHALAALLVDWEALEVEPGGELGRRLRRGGLVRAVLGDVVLPGGLVALEHGLGERGQRRGALGFVYRIYVIEPLAVETGVLVDMETRGRRVGLLGLRRDGLLGRGELFEVGRHGVVRRRAALPRL